MEQQCSSVERVQIDSLHRLSYSVLENAFVRQQTMTGSFLVVLQETSSDDEQTMENFHISSQLSVTIILITKLQTGETPNVVLLIVRFTEQNAFSLALHMIADLQRFFNS